MPTEQKTKKPRRPKQTKQPAREQPRAKLQPVEAGPAQPRDEKRQGITHLIECTCILPQYLRREQPIFHKFVVFSVLEPDDTVVEKIVRCNNCGIVHRITDVCKSEIVYGRDESRTAVTIDDLRWTLPSRLAELLTANDVELHVWEQAKFIVEEGRWGDHIVLSSEVVEGRRVGKFVTIAGPDRFGIAQYDENVDFSTSR